MGLKLNSVGEELDGVDDLMQSIDILVKTPKGAVPGRPTFGTDLYKSQDKPITTIRPTIVKDTIAAFRDFEPRMTLQTVVVDITGAGEFTVRVGGVANDGSAIQTQIGG